MSMVTSCPACTTTFRITPEQLKKREGKVRCGKCSGIFDAFKSLATLPDDAAASGEAFRSADPAPASSAAYREGERDRDHPSTMQGKLDIGGSSAAMEGLALAQARNAHERKRHRLWGGAAGVLVILLGLQLAYALRDQIAGAWPATYPMLDRACKALGCAVSFPRRTEQLAIESSDLQSDPQRPSVVVLTAALRNRGSSVVAHPSIELTLTNAQDQAVARRVFQPADYLTDPAAADLGMAGMAEVNVRIVLDTGDLKPSGYRVFLFYP